MDRDYHGNDISQRLLPADARERTQKIDLSPPVVDVPGLPKRATPLYRVWRHIIVDMNSQVYLHTRQPMNQSTLDREAQAKYNRYVAARARLGQPVNEKDVPGELPALVDRLLPKMTRYARGDADYGAFSSHLNIGMHSPLAKAILTDTVRLCEDD